MINRKYIICDNWFIKRIWSDLFQILPDPFQIQSSFLEKDLDPTKIQKKWSAIRIGIFCDPILNMYDFAWTFHFNPVPEPFT